MNFERPDYHGATDEIVRYSIDQKFADSMELAWCCGSEPYEMFKSANQYYIMCPTCGRHTNTYKHLYEAKQAWNIIDSLRRE